MGMLEWLPWARVTHVARYTYPGGKTEEFRWDDGSTEYGIRRESAERAIDAAFERTHFENHTPKRT